MHQLLCLSVYSGEHAFKQLWSVQQHDTNVQLYSDLRLVRFSDFHHSAVTALTALAKGRSFSQTSVWHDSAKYPTTKRRKKIKLVKIVAHWLLFGRISIFSSICAKPCASNVERIRLVMRQLRRRAIFTAYLRAAAALTSIWCADENSNQSIRARCVSRWVQFGASKQRGGEYRIFDEWHKSQSQS